MAALRAAFVALLLALAGPAWADFRGRVIAVHDGDSLTVLVERTQYRVRLAEIDAPEHHQAFGTRAKQALSELAYGREVLVVERGQDRYGRTLGTVFTDRRNLNAAMVAAGYAWVYRRYSQDPVLLQQELQAKTRKAGLWADPAPIAPWLFRKANAKGSP